MSLRQRTQVIVHVWYTMSVSADAPSCHLMHCALQLHPNTKLSLNPSPNPSPCALLIRARGRLCVAGERDNKAQAEHGAKLERSSLPRFSRKRRHKKRTPGRRRMARPVHSFQKGALHRIQHAASLSTSSAQKTSVPGLWRSLDRTPPTARSSSRVHGDTPRGPAASAAVGLEATPFLWAFRTSAARRPEEQATESGDRGSSLDPNENGAPSDPESQGSRRVRDTRLDSGAWTLVCLRLGWAQTQSRDTHAVFFLCLVFKHFDFADIAAATCQVCLRRLIHFCNLRLRKHYIVVYTIGSTLKASQCKLATGSVLHFWPTGL